MRHLPTNGGGPAITAILGNNAQMHHANGFCNASAYQSRQTSAIGVLFSATRSKSVPDVPTLKELGYDMEYYLWVGIFAPKATPPTVVRRCAMRSKRQ